MTKLVADLGGTHIRFALSDTDDCALHSIEKFTIRDYENIEHLLQVYLREKSASIEACCIAVAGPIVDQSVKMTNTDWILNATDINTYLDIELVKFINDFEAIAYSIGRLPDNSLIDIGSVQAETSNGPISLFGPGTGLGAALLVPTDSHSYKVIATEGGHAGLSARSEDELSIFEYWRDKGCRINREFFICGSGIERIHEALCFSVGITARKSLTAATIQQLGCNGNDEVCAKTMNIFCSFLGSAAGDQVLCTGSTGGLILAGGILPKFPEFLKQSNFRKRFESKGAMSSYNRAIKTSLIIEPNPGLIGAAAYLDTVS